MPIIDAASISGPTDRHRTARPRISPTGIESPFHESEIIVSKTDLRGHITYANDVFQRVSKYSHSELHGSPHSLIRHPAMPRVVFQMLWEELHAGREIFAYVLNLCRDGDHYWVFAHITPSKDDHGNIVGYHSSRRAVKRKALATIEPLYNQLAAIEQKTEKAGGLKADAIKASRLFLSETLNSKRITYDQFVWSL